MSSSTAPVSFSLFQQAFKITILPNRLDKSIVVESGTKLLISFAGKELGLFNISFLTHVIRYRTEVLEMEQIQSARLPDVAFKLFIQLGHGQRIIAVIGEKHMHDFHP